MHWSTWNADRWLPLDFITKGMGRINSSMIGVPYPISLANRTSFHENCLEANQCSKDDEKTEYPDRRPITTWRNSRKKILLKVSLWHVFKEHNFTFSSFAIFSSVILKNVFSDWVYLEKGNVQVLPNWKLKMYFNLKGKVHYSESEWLFTYLQAPTKKLMRKWSYRKNGWSLKQKAD